MNELFPFACGLGLGVLLGVLAPRMRWFFAAAASLVLGAAATVVSGEWAISPAFLLIDVPLVACSAFLSYAVARRLRTRAVGRRGTAARP
ncbi:hypothetical protein ACIBUY_35995 [Streptomyces sp. NPDC050085]|uniref:hypothetical protein n=1 Tax=Streptomyces sp. NPDC050085 TaxID=3365600 RepID=UPI003794828C